MLNHTNLYNIYEIIINYYKYIIKLNVFLHIHTHP